MLDGPVPDGGAEATQPFDFINDVEFRRSLESDYAEMQLCLASRASKAVLVLSGSIVEAVLTDYLISTGQKSPDPLRMTLDKLIDACRSAGVLTQRTADLSSVIRSYRNLIHAGRIRRLAETFDAEDAVVAASVVNIIAREVGKRQAKEFGLTAEQIVRKFETDPSAAGIVDLLLRETRPDEIERLLLDVLPDRYFERLSDFGADQTLASLAELFRTAFESSSTGTKGRVATRLAEVIREDAGPRVLVYEEQFFRPEYLTFMSQRQRDVVVGHLLERLRAPSPEYLSVDLMEAVSGLGHYLDQRKQRVRYVDGFLRTVAYAPDPKESVAKDLFISEFSLLGNPSYGVAKQRVVAWEKHLTERESDYGADLMRAIAAAIEDPVPF